jgi:hypothetical protein
MGPLVAPLGLPLRRPFRLAAALVSLAVVACAAPASPAPSTPVVVVTSAPSEKPSVPTGSTASPLPSAPPVTFVGAGDIASCRSSGDAATAALLAGIEGAVFTAGDNVYERGTSSEFTDCYAPTWGRELSRTWPAPGNHDYATRGAAGYFRYFGAAAGDPKKGWYAKDLGSWRIYVLNSNCSAIGGCGAGSPQERWLREDLAANPRTCALAIWHHPRFSSGLHGSSKATQALWQALEDAGAEIVISGHDHDYERFGPQTATGAADPAGIVEYVAGTGGRSHYPLVRSIANSLVQNDDTFGVLELQLYAASWTFEFVPVAGKTFTDQGSGTCH